MLRNSLARAPGKLCQGQEAGGNDGAFQSEKCKRIRGMNVLHQFAHRMNEEVDGNVQRTMQCHKPAQKDTVWSSRGGIGPYL